MREDGTAGSVAFDNMQQRQVNGTRLDGARLLPLRRTRTLSSAF
jgi:hypothetical protein